MKWNNMKPYTLILFLPFLAFSAHADNGFSNFRTLKCKFNDGYFTSTYGNKGEAVETKKTNDMLEIVFDSINRKAGKARMIGNAGAEDVSVTGTDEVLHIIEQTPSGNMNLMTVYNHPVPDNGLFSVYSRHVGNAHVPMVSYMIGACSPLF